MRPDHQMDKTVLANVLNQHAEDELRVVADQIVREINSGSDRDQVITEDILHGVERSWVAGETDHLPLTRQEAGAEAAFEAMCISGAAVRGTVIVTVSSDEGGISTHGDAGTEVDGRRASKVVVKEPLRVAQTIGRRLQVDDLIEARIVAA